MEPITDISSLGRRVRAARKSSGLDQRELALAAGVSTRTVHNIENAAPGVGTGKLLAVLTALGLSLALEPRRIHRVEPPTEVE